jgi:hypothetical protein
MPCWLQDGFGAFVGIGGVEGGKVCVGARARDKVGARTVVVVFRGFADARLVSVARRRGREDRDLIFEDW